MSDIIRVEKASGNFALEPCPFCGDKEVVYVEYQLDNETRWKVVCIGCMAMIDPGWCRNKSVLRTKWNMRGGKLPKEKWNAMGQNEE